MRQIKPTADFLPPDGVQASPAIPSAASVVGHARKMTKKRALGQREVFERKPMKASPMHMQHLKKHGLE